MLKIFGIFNLVVLICIIPFFSLGQNEYSLGEAEFTEEKEQSLVFTSFNKKDFSKLADSIDLSRFMPPAGDQGTKGSCWAWATTYVLRSVMDNNENYIKNNVLDSTLVYSPEYVYQYYKGNEENCNWGAYSFDMLNKILKDGVVKYSDFSYNEKACNNQPRQELKDKAKQYAKTGYIVDKLNDLYSIQKVLSQRQPLVISIRVDDFFCTKGNITSSSPFWTEYNTRKGSHAMVVVGYNNRLKAVKVLNSWGQNFGDRGYVWISYSIINSAMNYCCYPVKKQVSETVSRSVNKQLKRDANSEWPNPSQPYTDWFKVGYFRLFNGLRVGLASLDKQKKFAVIDIRDQKGNLKTSFYVEINSTKEFFVDGNKFQFTFNNLSNAGINGFKKAVYFTVERLTLQ